MGAFDNAMAGMGQEPPTIAQLALGLIKQMAPEQFDGLSDTSRQAVLAALAPLDVAAKERARDAAAAAVAAAKRQVAAAGRAMPAGVPVGRIPFAIPDDELARLDGFAEAADNLIGQAEGLDLSGDAKGACIGPAEEARTRCQLSLAYSAREACGLLRGLVAQLEVAFTPMVEVKP